MTDLVRDLLGEALEGAHEEDARETASIPKDVLAPETEESLISSLIEDTPPAYPWWGDR